MVATNCPDCGQWVEGDWSSHRKVCKKFDERLTKMEESGEIPRVREAAKEESVLERRVRILEERLAMPIVIEFGPRDVAYLEDCIAQTKANGLSWMISVKESVVLSESHPIASLPYRRLRLYEHD